MSGPIALEKILVTAHADGVLAWSPDSRKVVVTGSQTPDVPLIGSQGPVTTTLADAASGALDWQVTDGESTSVQATAFAPDGASIAVAAANQRNYS